jgi:hypothetical protein
MNTSLIKSLAASLAMAATASTYAAIPPMAYDPEPGLHSYYYLLYGISAGDIEAAADQFTEDAIVIAGSQCTPAVPCVGRPAIRERYLAALISRQAVMPLAEQRFDGARLTVHGEWPELNPATGRTRRGAGTYTFEFRNGRIALLIFRPAEER